MNIESVEFHNWQQFADRLTPKALTGKWYFRGAVDGNVQTSLERGFQAWGLPLAKMFETEQRLLREFKRALSLVPEANAPAPDDTLGWLALMQHHGAPTRLSDWTYSPFVAAYFAMEALLSDSQAASAVVWALSADPFDHVEDLVNSKTLLARLQHFRRQRDGASFEAVFFREKRPLRFVYPVNPAKLNQRLIIQQGVFLCPTDLTTSFYENLQATGRALRTLRMFKFILHRPLLGEAMGALHRMNMNPATLFPGLDGYSRNFRARLQFICEGDLFRETAV